MTDLQDAIDKWDQWGSMLGLKPPEQIWTEEEAQALVDAARRVADPDREAAVKALRRFIEAFEGVEAKPYGSAVDVVLFAALGITEDTE